MSRITDRATPTWRSSERVALPVAVGASRHETAGIHGDRRVAALVPQPHREVRLQFVDHCPDDPGCPVCAVHPLHAAGSGVRRPLGRHMMAARQRRHNGFVAFGTRSRRIFRSRLPFPNEHPILSGCSTNRKEVIRCRVISFSRTWPQRIALSGSSLPVNGARCAACDLEHDLKSSCSDK